MVDTGCTAPPPVYRHRVTFSEPVPDSTVPGARLHFCVDSYQKPQQVHRAGSQVNLLFSLQLLRGLPQPLPSIIRPVIQRNAYWSHPEALLLAMVADPVEQVRARAVQSIRQCRWQSQEQV